MKNYKFWNNWKRKTRLEQSAITSLNAARRIILHHIPKQEIVAIYAKGSFIRREMIANSDVDTSTIVRHSRWLRTLKSLQKKYRTTYEPNLEFTGYSLWELKNNKKAKIGKTDRPAPARTVQHLDHYKLLYGKVLNKNNFAQRDPITLLKNMVQAFRTLFLPAYNEQKVGFSGIVKQTFWLVENEQRAKGKNPPYHWGKLANSIKNKNHIVHQALKFRNKPTKDKIERARFIKRLRRYLSELEQLAK